MNPLPTQADAALARARRLVHDHKTRASKDGQTLNYGLPELLELLTASPCCCFCKMPTGWDVSLDHKTPTSRGGKDALENLAVACRRCNGIKGALTEGEFRELLTTLALMHPAARQDLERRLLAGAARYAGRRGRR
ncbi:MAG TPA: HNH endonuclease [Gemmataceae bacterium]|jgi:5-methylcytosine-specific restriction endonuclease McrA